MRRLTLAEAEALRGRPGATLALFLTDRCPVGCGHCSVSSRVDSPTITDWPLFTELIAGICALPALEAVAITGGEPFAERRGLRHAVRSLHAAGKAVVLFTSGHWSRTATIAPWITEILTLTSTVYLSTDSFHTNALTPRSSPPPATASPTAAPSSTAPQTTPGRPGRPKSQRPAHATNHTTTATATATSLAITAAATGPAPQTDAEAPRHPVAPIPLKGSGGRPGIPDESVAATDLAAHAGSPPRAAPGSRQNSSSAGTGGPGTAAAARPDGAAADARSGGGGIAAAVAAIEGAGCRLVLQVLDEPGAREAARELSATADISVIRPLAVGRGALRFAAPEERAADQFGRCSLVNSPTVRYDGRVSGCCNEAVIMGAGPQTLRRNACTAGEVAVALAELRADPVLHLVGRYGPVALQNLVAGPFRTVCEPCWAAQERVAADPRARVLIELLAGAR